MTSRVCVSCVSLSQRHLKASQAKAEAFGTSAVAYVAASARVKALEADMWKHVKVCKD